ncbi:5-hydroxytryptamine receptor 3A [Austrofundulus limnaeus]|uniref:5-hydroxytryptamine receptor 3A n=1 Tax=Austrofundulus limnaeus TaxID=52670 RepID=A0A2I4BRF3_AUSLI|nr:PREDICTED: 5-hydroxytryptamine receptor 3A-like [Austrofundulus limnaeus]
MRVYRFPFDIQSCTITFKSQSYDDNELQIADRKKTNETENQFQTQDEWVLKNFTWNKGTAENVKKQTTLIFTITMQRWSALYIANFLFPVLFFLSLDLASFLISDTGGQKLGFKITVLLAVTVMQLLLNEILPGSSDKIPLIAIFCIGIFTLMLLSVLETILVMNLIDRDASSQEETEQNMKKKRENKLFCFGSSKDDDSAGKTPFVINELFRDEQAEESINLKMVLEELKEVLLNHRKDEEKEGYWTKMAKRIDKIFTAFYFSSVVLFLLVMCSLWMGDD